MTALARAAALVEEYLLVWVLLSVAVGLLVPSVAVLTPLSTPILAVMIGSISLTLSPTAFRSVRRRALGVILLVQTGMPVLAYGIARLLALSPTLTLGFVVLGAVTPELVAPVMTELGGGDTALSTTVLVLVGLGSLVLVPGAVAVLLGDAGTTFETGRIVESLLLAVVGPMSVAVALRSRYPARVGRYDGHYTAVSALMVIAIIGIVTAANAAVLRRGGPLVVAVGAGALLLNLLGYAGGWVATISFGRAERIAGLFSVGMRDFAVAAGLLVSAGVPAAALPAVVFGIVEMATSATLVRWLQNVSS
ncbi:bile acid:sodium symporter family protein [Halorientalis pallida]|uniref:bile acid:sodium symporter family protein n=1 Tax=Halorientalis pallida TaxID=2479928 RepID=UPI003C6FB36B